MAVKEDEVEEHLIVSRQEPMGLFERHCGFFWNRPIVEEGSAKTV